MSQGCCPVCLVYGCTFPELSLHTETILPYYTTEAARRCHVSLYIFLDLWARLEDHVVRITAWRPVHHYFYILGDYGALRLDSNHQSML